MNRRSGGCWRGRSSGGFTWEGVEGEHELERIRREQVIAARAAGASWQQIGDALGVTRQSAWESFTAETRAALAAALDANDTLAENDAVDLAVDEVRAVRRRRTAP